MIKIGVIGCGQRMRKLCGKIARYDQAEITAVYDPSDAQIQRFFREVGSSSPPRRHRDWEDLADDDLDWVMIGSPNVFHASQAIGCLEKGKHVFLEKPLAVTRRECIDLADAWALSKRKLVTGFVLRWSPLYRQMKHLLETMDFGPVISLQASENISYAHGCYIMKNWRRNEAVSGPFILEKCVHDLDLLQWMASSPVVRTAAVSGKALYTEMNSSALPKEIVSAWDDKGNLDADTPFGDGPDRVDDHTLVLMEFQSGAKGQFMTVAGSAVPERRLNVCCLKGTLIGELYSGTLRYRTVSMDHEHMVTWDAMGLHGAGDDPLAEDLYLQMTGERNEQVSVIEGLQAVLCGIAAGEAAVSGGWVEVSHQCLKV